MEAVSLQGYRPAFHTVSRIVNQGAQRPAQEKNSLAVEAVTGDTSSKGVNRIASIGTPVMVQSLHWKQCSEDVLSSVQKQNGVCFQLSTANASPHP